MKVVGPRLDWSRWRIDQREQRRGSSGSPAYIEGQGEGVVWSEAPEFMF